MPEITVSVPHPMENAMRIASLPRIALGLTLLLTCGCGEPKGERWVKTDVKLTNSFAAEVEAVAANPALLNDEDFNKRKTKIEEEFKAHRLAMEKLTIEEVKLAKEKYKSEVDQAHLRMRTALKSVLALKKK